MTLDQFEDQCHKLVPDAEAWILANPFDQAHTNKILRSAEDSTLIDALVIIYETPLEAQGYYTAPKLISKAGVQEGRLLKAFMGPKGEASNKILARI